MTITHKIEIDLAAPRLQPPIRVMQGDAYSRRIEISLMNDGTAWEPPDGVAIRVGYSRVDGTRGFYDTLPDGSAAGSVDGNTVTVAIAPKMLTAPGGVPLAVTLILGDAEISTFPVMLQVAARPGYGGAADSTYTGEVEVT